MSHSLQHLKEYTAYEFDLNIRSQKPPIRTLPLIFEGRPMTCRTELPTYLLDSQQESDSLYILKWNLTSTSASLDFFQYREVEYRRLSFNQRPSLLCVASDHLFIVGGEQLYVIEIANLTVLNSFQLSHEEELYTLEPAFLGSGEKDKGAILYFWNSKTGLSKKTFSTSNSESNGLWSVAKNFLRKADRDQYGTLRVIVPNVLGLLIHHTRREIFPVSLTDMKIITHTSFKLESEAQLQKSTPIILKYQQSQAEGFDDSLIIGIGDRESEFISIFQIGLMYCQEHKKTFLEVVRNQGEKNLPPISSFINGYMVDWSKTQVRGALTVSAQGRVLDFILNDKGVIYLSEQPSRIPTANYVEYSYPEYRHPILALEHNISRLYLKDFLLNVNFRRNNLDSSANNEEHLMNSVLTPNRYSVPFLLASTGTQKLREVTPSMLEPRKLLLNWHKYFKPKNLIRLNRDVVVLRESSLTTFLPITVEQFLLEVQSGEDLIQHFRQNSSRQGSEGSSFISKQSSRFENFIVGDYPANDQPNEIALASERILHKHDQEEQSYQTKAQNARLFEKYFTQLFPLTTGQIGIRSAVESEDRIQNKSILFAQTLLGNRVKDILAFYHRILTRTIEASGAVGQEYLNQKLVVHYLRCFSLLLTDAAHMACDFGTDMVGFFINKHAKVNLQKTWVDIDRQSNKILSQLFYDLIKSDSTQVGINQMIKELILLQQSNFSFPQKILSALFSSEALPLLPYTRSVLAGVCSLPIPSVVKHRFINSFVLARMEEQKSFNENANRILQEFKDLTRCLPNSNLKSYHNFVQQSLLNMGGGNFHPNTKAMEESTLDMSEVDLQGLDTMLQADFWKNIRVSEAEQLQSTLFERDLVSLLRIKDAVVNYRNIRENHASITDDDFLAAWVFLFRNFVKRLQELLENLPQQIDAGSLKQDILGLSNSAQEGLLNIGEYYQKCYKVSKEPSQDFLVEKVSSQMIGLEPPQVYGVMADSGILGFISFVASLEEAEGEVFSELKNLVFMILSHSLQFQEEGDIRANFLRASRYISKQEINEMILGSIKLQKLYQERLSNQTKALLGYNNVNSFSTSLKRPSQLPFEGNTGFRNSLAEAALQQ